MTLADRIKNSWNAFFNRDPTSLYNSYSDGGSYYRPDRVRLSMGNERSIITSIFNRIALDVAAIDINHCRLDEDDRFKEVIYSSLNKY